VKKVVVYSAAISHNLNGQENDSRERSGMTPGVLHQIVSASGWRRLFRPAYHSEEQK